MERRKERSAKEEERREATTKQKPAKLVHPSLVHPHPHTDTHAPPRQLHFLLGTQVAVPDTGDVAHTRSGEGGERVYACVCVRALLSLW